MNKVLYDFKHLQHIHQEMPATIDNVYLNAGAFGPLPICVIQAMQERLQDEWREGRLSAKVFGRMLTIYANARSAVARLLHADVGEIALTDNTGEGMNIVCYGFNWRAGDEIITTNHEHIGALAPLYQLRDRYGITIRVADLGAQADRPLVEAISELVTARTRLISLSHVTWTTDTVLDVQSVGQMGRAKGIPVLVDGAQSAGAIPINIKALSVDFYALPMQKWLCGPDGTGALYVSNESLHYLQSTYVGYWSVKHEEDIEWTLCDNARRFEVGGRQTAALAGQCAALNWLEYTVGYDWLFQRISALHSYAYHALQTLAGLTMLTPQAGASGLLAFTLEGRDVDELVRQLREDYNIHVRSIPTSRALRVSTGFYNSEEDIDQLVSILRKLLK
jgi:L-cysteine/cystine lyase